jgi:hypothetical protein
MPTLVTTLDLKCLNEYAYGKVGSYNYTIVGIAIAMIYNIYGIIYTCIIAILRSPACTQA